MISCVSNLAISSSSKIRHGHGRVNLTLWSSSDSGHSWAVERLIAPGVAAYSSLASLSASRVGVLYENGPGKIRFFTLDIGSRVEEAVVV